MLDGYATDVYAVLLYENATYERAEGEEAMARYAEYSRWVAEARERGQWITGQDLDADEGWRLLPDARGPRLDREAPTAVGSAPVSGIFLLHAAHDEEALALARELPHLRHGGVVVVQKTLPTAEPPDS